MKETVKLPFIKRVFDIIASTVLLLVFLPVIVFILFLMTAEQLFKPASRGPFMYSETRISQGEKFKLYKFRIFTLKSIEQAQKFGVVHTKKLEKDKKNMTFVGRMLKKIYFDELPQLYNVLKGDMSLVGPRPTNIENYQRGLMLGKESRTLIKAGVTGYFQSHKGLLPDADQEMLDMEYVEFVKSNPGWRVLMYDAKIIIVSIRTVFRAEGI